MSWALALPLTPRFAPRAVAATPSGDFFIVNGWVLTRADLVALKLDDL